MSRTERPEQIQAPALRSIIKMIDMAIENGSLNPQDRDEVIQMFISGPTTVVDNKAGGGMMNINDMIKPIGMAGGGPISPEEPKDVKKIGLLDDAADLRILSMKLVLKEAAGSLLEMDEIDNMTPIEIESMFNSLIGKKGA